MKKYLLAAALSILSVNMSMAWNLCNEVDMHAHRPVVGLIDYTEGSEGQFSVGEVRFEGTVMPVKDEDRMLDMRTYLELFFGVKEPSICGYAEPGAAVIVKVVDLDTFDEFENVVSLEEAGDYRLQGNLLLRVSHKDDHRKDSWSGAIYTAVMEESFCNLPVNYIVEIKELVEVNEG